MKIYENDKEVLLDTLPDGQMFIHKNNLYLKGTEEQDDYLCYAFNEGNKTKPVLTILPLDALVTPVTIDTITYDK